MAPLKIVRVVSYSSEDPNQPAENLVKDGTYRKWRCKQPGEPKAWVELQIEKTSLISNIDIGNHGSAFIEVLVGRSGCSEDEYKVLLNTSTFMTPQECRNETNLQRVRIFKQHEFNKATQSEKWDRIRVVCTQPFNRQLQYGISFITVHAPEEVANGSSDGTKPVSNLDLGGFKLKAESALIDPVRQGSLFSRFKSANQSMMSSPETQRSSVRAASQSLASIALAQSEQEALTILRKTPKKEGRPDIKLTDKLKSSHSPTTQKTAFIKAEQEAMLPSRKVVDSDRPKPPTTPTTPTAKPRIQKTDVKSTKSSASDELKRTAPSKRKTPPPSNIDENDHKMKKPKVTKPFNQLLDGVVAVLSGFQNPLRSQLRDKLLALGAKYKPDWNASCTHLICAFYNTPKFLEVKGKGKIVTKNWVEDCYARKKRFPWRRYCLDKNDRKEESEEEIWAEENPSRSTLAVAKPSTSKEAGNAVAPSKASTSAESGPSSPKEVDLVTSAIPKAVESDEDYGGSTEVDDEDTDDEIDRIKKKMLAEQQLLNQSQSADFFSEGIFLLGKDLPDEVKKELSTCITDFKGKVIPKLNSTVNYYITDNPNERSINKAKSKNSDVQIVKTDWIRECQKSQKLVSTNQFLIGVSN